MKKRILSVLLLLAMLLTMIPFAANAEEVSNDVVENGGDENEAVTEKDYDYHDRYVTDGLVGLFTAFDSDDDTVSLSEGTGTWKNRVNDSLNATFAGKDWKMGANGGVGYALVYGNIVADETAEGGKKFDKNATTNNTYTNNDKLVFGLDLLPDEDYELEYVALYTPTMTWDATTSTLVSLYDNGGSSPYEESAPDVIGFYSSFTISRGGGGASLGVSNRGGVRWRVMPRASFGELIGWSTCPNGWAKHTGDSSKTDNRSTGVIATYGIKRNETLTVTQIDVPVMIEVQAEDEEGNLLFEEDGTTPVMTTVQKTDDEGNPVFEKQDKRVVTAAFTHYYNRASALYANSSAKSPTTMTYSSEYVDQITKTYNNDGGHKGYTNAALAYYDADDDTDFFLSYRLGTDFYAVRIYAANLLATEREYNHMIDVMEYYNLAADDAFFNDVTAVRKLQQAAKSVGFETEELSFAANKEALQAIISFEIPVYVDAHDLYVQDGLANLFSVYGAKNGVDLAAGTWTDMITGAKATFVGSAPTTNGNGTRWSVNANGSVGYNAWSGGVYADGTTAARNEDKNFYFGLSKLNHINNRDGHVDLGIELLPTGDLTVELVGMSKPAYMADLAKSDGNNVVYAVKADGTLYEAYVDGQNYDGSDKSNGYAHHHTNVLDSGDPISGYGESHWLYDKDSAFDAIGRFGSYNICADGHWWSVAPKSRGEVFWMTTLQGWNGTGARAYFGKEQNLLLKSNDPFWTLNTVRTYGYYVDETTQDHVVSAVFGLYRDTANYADTSKYNITSNGDASLGLLYTNEAEWSSDSRFYFGSSRPSDFYGIRIYDRVLTEDERKQNRAVDAMLYYGATFTTEQLEDAEFVARVYEIFEGATLETESAAYDATKETLTAAVANLAADIAYIKEYAAYENLVALFSVFSKDSYNLEAGANGTWRNLVGGKNATLVNAARWSENANGSIGYNAWSGVVNADGTTTRQSGANGTGFSNLNNITNREGHLDLGVELLPTEDLTVEILAMSKPMYMADGAKSDANNVVYAVKADGTLYETVMDRAGSYQRQETNIGDYGRLPSGAGKWLTAGGGAIDAIGRYGLFDVFPDGAHDFSAAGARGSVKWYTNLNGWSGNRKLLNNNAQTLANASDAFWTVKTMRTYGIYIDETTEGDVTSALIGMYRDGVKYKDTTGVEISTAIAEDDANYLHNYYVNEAEWSSDSRFYFGASRPTDFFVVRVYDKVLTQEEREQNIFVDTMHYYGVEIPAELDEAATSEVLALVKSMPFAADPLTKAANQAVIQTMINAFLGVEEDTTVEGDTLYVTDGIVGLFTAFDKAETDAYVTSTGANKIWLNRVSGKNNGEFLGGSLWTVGENGGIGKVYMSGTMQLDGTTYASAAAAGYTNTTIDAKYELDFGIGLLPKDDFTVEQLAYFPPKYAVEIDAEGNPTGNFVGHHKGGTGDTYGYQIDRYGFLEMLNVNPGGVHYQSDVAGMHPRMNDCPNATWYNETGSAKYGFAPTTASGWIDGTRRTYKVDTYGITRDETPTYDANGAMTRQTAQISWRYNGAAHQAQTYDTNKITTNEDGTLNYTSQYKYFLGEDVTLGFHLSRSVGVTYYAVRVYNRVLSDSEQLVNRAADIIYYLDLEIPEALVGNEALYGKIVAAASEGMSPDAAEKAILSAEVQALVDGFEATMKEDEKVIGKYAARDNLKSLFTIFRDGSVDLEAGSWRNLMGGASATFGNKDEWKFNDNGSVGFNMYYGTYIDGVYAKSASGDGTSNYFTYGTRLDFGIDMLPADDFTVEYMAQYKPYYVTDGNGKLVLDANNKPMETYNAVVAAGKDAEGKWLFTMPTADPGGSIDRAVIRIGYLAAHTYTYDGSWGGTPTSRAGGTRWVVSSTAQWAYSNIGTQYPTKGSEQFVANDVVRTYAISRTEDATNKHAATHTWYKDGRTFYSSTLDTSALTIAADRSYAKVDFTIAEKDLGATVKHDKGADVISAKQFWLSERWGTDFYTVRIYDKVLTEDERIQNIAADVMLYYGIELPEAIKNDADLLKLAYETLASSSIVTNPADKQAEKAEINEAINAISKKKEMLTAYAATDNLTALYTTFIPGTVDMTAGKWTDILGGATATMTNKDRWLINDDGSVGFNIFHGTFKEDGTWQAEGKDTRGVGTKLNFGIEQLPEGDFTVDYTANYKPIYVYDANQADGIARDAAGRKLETFSYFQSTGVLSADKGAVDSFGWFESRVFSFDQMPYKDFMGGTGYAVGDPTTRGSIHFSIVMNDWYTTNHPYGFLGGKTNRSYIDGLHKHGDNYHTYDIARTYAIVLDESVTGEGENEVTSALFSLNRDGAFYESNISAGGENTSANPVYDRNGSKGYFAHDEKYSDYSYTKFALSGGLPVDFYTVRVYNKALSTEELLYNHMVDLLYFYELELDEAIAKDEKLIAQFAAAVSGVVMSRDGLEAAVAKLAIKDAAAALTAEESPYFALYAEGMTSHFSSLTPADTTASVKAGVWQNRVAGGENAKLGNAGLWFENPNGSIGYNLTYGQVDSDGVFTASSSYNTFDNAGSAPLNVGTRLDLNIQNLPADDFTVEILAMFKPIYVTDTAGDIAYGEDGKPLEAWVLNGNKLPNRDPGGYYEGAPFRIGYLAAHAYPHDGVWSNGTQVKERGTYRWVISSSAGWSRSNSTDVLSGKTTSGPFTVNGTVGTYAITRAEDENDTAKATYAFIRNFELYHSYDFDSNAVTHNVNGYGEVDFSVAEKDLPATVSGTTNSGGVWQSESANKFWISERIPTDFYAIRIYDRVLTEEEYAYNHLADIAIYYGLDLGEEIFAGTEKGDELLTAFLAMAKNVQIVSDGLEKRAVKESLQASIDQLLYENEYVSPSDYDSMYVQNGLVGLFTSFAGDDSADVMNGTWKNKATSATAVALGDATINGKWTEGLSGIGYRITVDNMTTFRSTVKAGDGYGISLNDAYEDLASFTVETFAMAVGATDENGNCFVSASEPFVDGRDNFRFGLLTSLGFGALHLSNGKISGASLRNRWAITNLVYGGGNWTAAESYFWATPTEENPNKTSNTYDDDAWFDMRTDVMTPVPGTMQVTKSTAGGNVNYTIAYNYANPVFDVTLSEADHATLLANTSRSTEEGRRFSFFNTMPATVYAIRVYDRVLSEQELLINAFVDKAAYYQLEVDNFNELSDVKKSNIAAVFADLGYFENAEDMQALYDFYANDAAKTLTETVISVEGYAPILANASGYRVLFEVNKPAYDLLVKEGYTVSYGALVAPGGSINALENVTLENENVKNIVVEGEGGSGIYYKPAGANGYYYSAAVTADDAAYYTVGMIVRGYVTVTKGEESYVVYTDAALNGANEVSILDAADYFVNAFDGDVVTQYTYMNSAALRAILAEYDYASRASLADDLKLYVDAANGNDENNGLAEDTAYATVNKAFDAAKAHFAKNGRKTVTIYLAEGTYYVTEELSLKAEDILADAYALDVIGMGDTTVLTTEVMIDLEDGDAILEDDDENYYVQLPKVKNADGTESYPHFRAVYADGELVNIASAGNMDVTWPIADFYNVDAQGNVLEPAKNEDGKQINDWALDAVNFAKAEYAVFKLPAAMFNTSKLALYAGAELHYTWTWETSMSHIDHVTLDPADSNYVLAYVPYGQLAKGRESSNIEDGRVWMTNALIFTTDSLHNRGKDTEYFYDEDLGRLYYEDLDIVDTFSYAGLNRIFNFEGVDNISISNLAMTGVDSDYITKDVGAHYGQAGSIVLRNNAKQATSLGFCENAAVYGKNVGNLTLENVSVYDVLSSGLTIKGYATDITVDSSRFENLGGSAIQLVRYTENDVKHEYIKDINITNNYVANTGRLIEASAAIMTGNVASAKITGNSVIGATWSSISVGYSWSTPSATSDDIVYGATFYCYDLEIAYNYVTDMMLTTGDGGAFYLNGGAVDAGDKENPLDDDTSVYNYLHHNYVVMSAVSGLQGGFGGTFSEEYPGNSDGWRNVYCYYFENSTSNWLATENVLVNEVNTYEEYANATFLGVYFQTYNGSEARNITMVDNYWVGIESLAKLYRDVAENPNPQYNCVANDYLFATIGDLATDTLKSETWANATTKTEITGAAAKVAGIYNAAGSDVSTVNKISALTIDASQYAAAERVVLKDMDQVNVSEIEGIETGSVVFTDGTTSVTVRGLVGATVKAPGYFAQPDHVYTFTVNGKVVDLATLKIAAEPVTVYVDVEADTNKITFVGGVQNVVLDVFEGESFEVPEALQLPGKVPTFYYDGAAVDPATFKMPAYDIEIRVEYKDAKYTASFVDEDGNVLKQVYGYFGNIVENPKLTQAHHTTKYSVDGEEITIGKYAFGESDIEILVEFIPNEYEVTFKAYFNTAAGPQEHTYGTVTVVYGQAIDASAIETPALRGYLDGYLATFVEWEDFESGVTVLNQALMDAGSVIYAVTEWTALPKHTVTFVGEGIENVTAEFSEGVAITVPAELEKAGYKVILSVGGEVIDLATYRMPETDVEITVTYEVIEYTVTITDGEKSDTFQGILGADVTFATSFAKDHHTTVYKVNGQVIDLATYKVTGDAEILVTYEAIEYTVTITDGKDNTVEFTGAYGTAIDFDAASFDKEGFTTIFKVAGEAIDIATITAIEGNLTITVEYEANAPAYKLGDINGDNKVDIDDIVAVINVASGTNLDPAQFPGNTDLNGDSKVDIDDIVAVINIASGS